MATGTGVEWFDQPGGEPVELREPRAEWSEIATSWMENITRVLLPRVVRVEHVGSTAVPGLVAKPVIDLQVSVREIADEADAGLLDELAAAQRARASLRRAQDWARTADRW